MVKTKNTKSRKVSSAASLGLIGVGLLLLGILAVFLLPGLVQPQDQDLLENATTPVITEFQAPEITLNNLEGETVALSDYRGKVVLVNNWATWCPPCKEEMPGLQAYFDDHQRQDFTVIAIEAGESLDEVMGFVREKGFTFPVWLDPDQQALTAFRNYSLPSSYIIDRDGIVRLAWMGMVSRNALEKYLTPLLEE